jgi:cobalamin synthase
MENEIQQNPQVVVSLPGIKALLKQSWQIYKAGFKTFIAIAAVSLTAILISYVSSSFFPINLILILGLSFLSLWQAVALFYAVKDREQRLGFKEAFTKALPKLWPYLLTSILVGLAVIGGLILLIIPGIIFAFWFFFAEYLVIAEDLSGKAALSRSKQLMKGKIGAVFARTFVVGLIIGLIYWIIGLIFGMFFTKNIAEDLSSVLSIFLMPYSVIYTVLIYEALKKIKG